MRKEDTFGRFGGEEFLLVLPDTTPEQALIVAEKVRYLIAHHPFPVGREQPLGFVTVSGGIAAYPPHGLDSRRAAARRPTSACTKRSGRDATACCRAAAGVPRLKPATPPSLPAERRRATAVSWDWSRE